LPVDCEAAAAGASRENRALAANVGRERVASIQPAAIRATPAVS
jgi:hypothetical protein